MVVLVAYTLPWVVSPSTALTLGAYDLAEWLSLHPVSRTTYMLPTLLLRVPLMFLVLLVVFSDAIPRWLRAVAMIVGCAALLPPFEFLTQPGDQNYQQQFALVVIVLVMGSIGLMKRFRPRLVLIALLTGLVVSSLWGNFMAYHLMTGYRLPVQYGLGGILLVGAALVYLVGVTKRGSK